VALDGKVVIDAGAGTGRVAFAVAPLARHVFAVEPVAAMRRYMRDKSAGLSVDNLFVLDGFLHAIPLPAKTADVLVTCQAIGWDLPGELVEIQRVLKSGGIAVHLIGAANAAQAQAHPFHQSLVEDGYRSDVYEDGTVQILRYWRPSAR
jgi:ubiquinone/menaquinone biosynthesis C-methylase UbiE